MLGHYILAVYDNNGEWPIVFNGRIAIYDTVREASEATGIGLDEMWDMALNALRGKSHRIEIRGKEYTLWAIDENE